MYTKRFRSKKGQKENFRWLWGSLSKTDYLCSLVIQAVASKQERVVNIHSLQAQVVNTITIKINDQTLINIRGQGSESKRSSSPVKLNYTCVGKIFTLRSECCWMLEKALRALYPHELRSCGRFTESHKWRL